MKVKNIIKKVKAIWPLHALQVLLSVLPVPLGGQKAEKSNVFIKDIVKKVKVGNIIKKAKLYFLCMRCRSC